MRIVKEVVQEMEIASTEAEEFLIVYWGHRSGLRKVIGICTTEIAAAFLKDALEKSGTKGVRIEKVTSDQIKF